MIRAFFFLMLINSSFAGAVTLNPLSCLEALSSKLEASRAGAEIRFKKVISEIRAGGAAELLAPLDSGAVKPVFKGLRMPWQAMVSGREGWTGKLTLKVRDVEFANEKEYQKAVWDTAIVLFELETRAALWSRRSVLTPDGKREFDLSMRGSDDAFEYFMYSQPREWREAQLKRIEILEGELYGLLGNLNLLKPEDLLPKKDAGRFWYASALYGGDASRSVTPNLADFEKWKNGAAPNLRARHGRSFIFNYYMNFMKRAVILGMLAQVAAGLPSMQNVPGYLDAMFAFRQFSSELDNSPSKTQELNQRYLENVKKAAAREEDRLKKAIELKKSVTNFDLQELQELEKELAELYDLYPWLAHGKN